MNEIPQHLRRQARFLDILAPNKRMDVDAAGEKQSQAPEHAYVEGGGSTGRAAPREEHPRSMNDVLKAGQVRAGLYRE